MRSGSIYFGAPMVRALLDGRKTQTRRLITPPPPDGVVRHCWYHAPRYGFTRDADVTAGWHVVRLAAQPGDRLWVRESYFQFGHWESIAGALTKGGRQKWCFVADQPDILFDAPAAYRKGMSNADAGTPAWHKRLGRFMPRKVSRMTLVVTDVLVERLQDISREDAIAEGIESKRICGVGDVWKHYGNPDAPVGWNNPIQSYQTLWNSINGASSWDANPWVGAYSFIVEHRNINAGEARGS